MEEFIDVHDWNRKDGTYGNIFGIHLSECYKIEFGNGYGIVISSILWNIIKK
jgi:hypothetical protein